MGNMIITFKKIKSERIQERMLKAYTEQEEAAAEQKEGEKKGADDAAGDEEDFADEEFNLTDIEFQEVMTAEEGGGKMFRKIKFYGKFCIKCRCFKRASVKN